MNSNNTNNSKKRSHAAMRTTAGTTKETASSSSVAFSNSLTTSLAQNRQLQQKIYSALTSLGRQKVRNRQRAFRLTRELYLEVEQPEVPAANSKSNNNSGDGNGGKAGTTSIRKLLKILAKTTKDAGDSKSKDAGNGIIDLVQDTAAAAAAAAAATTVTEASAADSAAAMDIGDTATDETTDPIIATETTLAAATTAARVPISVPTAPATIPTPTTVESILASMQAAAEKSVRERAQHHLQRPTPKQMEPWKFHPYNNSNNDPLNRSFFSDPLGSVPNPNTDTQKRRRFEATVMLVSTKPTPTPGNAANDDRDDNNANATANVLLAGGRSPYYLPHLSPPWTKAETKLLMSIVNGTIKAKANTNPMSIDNTIANTMDNDNNNTNISNKTAEVDAVETEGDLPAVAVAVAVNYENVAKALEQDRKFDSDCPRKLPRSALECQLQCLRIKHDKLQPKWTKAESSKAVEHVQRLYRESKKQLQYKRNQVKDKEDGNSDDNDETDNENVNVNDESLDKGADNDEDTRVDWQAVADAVGNDRSPWQCFTACQTLRPPNVYPRIDSTHAAKLEWTPLQDELLLTYFAAMGPQLTLDAECAAELSRKFLPDKRTVQITLRVNSTMLNPKLQQQIWNLTDERKLVLSQKIFRDDTARVSAQFSQRSSRSVREKWNRTLDPAFNTTRPFSADEDQLLLKLVRDRLDDTVTATNTGVPSSISWFEMARDYFPDRRPERIQARWHYELATQEDVLKKTKVDLLVEQQHTLLHHSSDRSTVVQTDFALKVVPKKKKKQPPPSSRKPKAASKKSS